MKKRVLILILEFLICSVLISKEISFNDANIIAENWTRILEEKFDDQVRIKDGREIYRDSIIVAYVFEFYPKGYMVVSAQDYLPPIKMYSLENDFSTSGAPFEEQIFGDFKTIILKVKKGEITPKKEYLSKNKARFNRLLNRDRYGTLSSFKPQEDITEEVEPLLTSRWGQGSPYNDNCPIVNGVKTPAGCVGLSFSQMMNYYEWPARGTGSESYYQKYGDITISTSFEKEYKWWDMEDYRNNKPEGKIAVAELCYDVGVAIHSDYRLGSTAANSKFYYNLVEHFYYSTDMEVIDFFKSLGVKRTLDEWFGIAKNQIDNGWPVKLSISGTYGHAAVIDGYRISDGLNMVHINFGWSGSYNGYFTMYNIVPSDNLNFDEYEYQDMTINFYPYPGYKRPMGKAPNDIHGNAYLNRSVFLSEYVCQLTWSESPSEDKRIFEYIIYRQKDGSTEELARVKPEDGHVYEFRIKDYNEYIYSVGVEDKNGVISSIPEFIRFVLKK